MSVASREAESKECVLYESSHRHVIQMPGELVSGHFHVLEINIEIAVFVDIMMYELVVLHCQQIKTCTGE